MQDPPDWARLVSDGREVERSLQRLRKRSEDVVEAGRLERTNLWSGSKPRLAAGYRELAAEWRRCAALAASVGLRDTHGDGSTWLETAASCRQAAEAWEGIARLTAGWGWRKPRLVGAAWGALTGLLLGGSEALSVLSTSGC